MKISVALLHVDSPFARGEASRAARAILADLLRKNGIPCEAADLDRDERGRPYFTDPALHREIDFNLSHTDKTVAVAIAIRENEGETPRVGIDVEVPHPRIRKKQTADTTTPSSLSVTLLTTLPTQPPCPPRQVYLLTPSLLM